MNEEKSKSTDPHSESLTSSNGSGSFDSADFVTNDLHQLDFNIPIRDSVPGTLNIIEPKSREGSKKIVEYSRENSEQGSSKAHSRHHSHSNSVVEGAPMPTHTHTDSTEPLMASQPVFSQIDATPIQKSPDFVSNREILDDTGEKTTEVEGEPDDRFILPRISTQSQSRTREGEKPVSPETLGKKSQLSSFMSQSSQNLERKFYSLKRRRCKCLTQCFHEKREEYLYSYKAFNYAKGRLYIFALLFIIGTFFCLVVDHLITAWINLDLKVVRVENGIECGEENGVLNPACDVRILDEDALDASIMKQPWRIVAIIIAFVMTMFYWWYPWKTKGVAYRSVARSSFNTYFGIFEYHQIGMCLWFVALGVLLGVQLAQSQNQMDGVTNVFVLLIFMSASSQYCPLTFGYVLITNSVASIAGVVGTGFWLFSHIASHVDDENLAGTPQMQDLANILLRLFILVIAIFLLVFAGLMKSSWEFEKARRRSFSHAQQYEKEKTAKEMAEKETSNLRGQVFQLTLKLGDLVDHEEEKIDFETSYEKAINHLNNIMKRECLSANGYDSLQSVVKILTSAKATGFSGLYEPAFMKQVSIVNLGDSPNVAGGGNDDDLQQWLHETFFDPEDFVDTHDDGNNKFLQSWQSMMGYNGPKHPTAIEIGPVQPDDEGAFKELLQNHLHDWAFDIFKLRQLTKGRPLYSVGFALFYRYNLVKKFHIDETKLRKFLTAVEDGYLDNPYHNSMHGADVAQAVHFFLSNTQIHQFLTDNEKIGIIISALVHDFEHPGLTNKFLIAAEDVLSTRYNDKHVLENHHLACATQILQRPACAILENVSPSDKKEIRSIMIHCVLATDLASHFEHIGNFKRRMTLGDPFDVGVREDRINILTMALKCADLGHASKPREIHHRWTKLVMEEFYRQGDKERRLGLPISAFMDRNKPQVAKSQTGFIDYLVKPLWECWVTWLDSETIYNSCFKTLLENHEEWKQMSLEESDPDFRDASPVTSNTQSPTTQSPTNVAGEQADNTRPHRELSPVFEEHKSARADGASFSPISGVENDFSGNLSDSDVVKSQPGHKKNRVSFQDESEMRNGKPHVKR